MHFLQGRTAIITGASRGIGAATARFFAEQGVHLVLVATNAQRLDALAKELTSCSVKLRVVAGSVADYATLESACRAAREIGGRTDILINNAGLIEPIARIEDSDPDSWSEIIDVNIKGVYYGIRAVLPTMLEAGAGTIINLSSGAATNALEGWSHYCASKAAVLSLTRCVHREHVEHGIRSIGISPGTVATDMQVEIRESGINPVSQLPASAHIPGAWVARAIAFLCGPGGDAYRGTDFSLKTNEGREAAGLPLIDAAG